MRLTVLSVNDAPEAVGTIPTQQLEEGGDGAILDLSPYFTDADGDALTYTAESSDSAATVVRVSGSVLTLAAVVTGVATVTVTATDALGLKATRVFEVTVGDRLVREVLTDTLAALGRGHLSSVRQTVGRRLETAGADTSRLALAGQYFSPTMWNRVGSGSLAQTHEWYFRASMLQQVQGTTGILGTSADPRLRESGFLGFGGFVNDWNRALLGTDMLFTFGGREAATDSGRGRTRWTVWGQGDLQMFRGSPSDVKDYEGNLRTGYVGVDTQLTRRWLLGVAMARSGGTGMWQRGASAGELSTTLTRVHPYVRWANDDTVVWGVLGAGRGTATHVRTLTGLRETSPLRLGLGLLESRRRVATVGRGLEIGIRGEASWVHLATGGGSETIDDLQAGVRRLRGGVEVTRLLSGPRGVTFTPFGAVSTRRDSGAGQTGVGLEVAGGMRVRGGRLQVEAQGRRLVLHSATDYEEQGVSVAASVGAGLYESGLTLSVRPTWGATGMGAETLWQDQIQKYMVGPGYDASGIETRLGYGMRLRGRSLLTPFGSYGQRQGSGRRLQAGVLVGSLGRVPGASDAPIELEISGERYERPGGNPDHRFSIIGVVNLRGSGAPDTARLEGISTSPRLNPEVAGEVTPTEAPWPRVATTETRTKEEAPAESSGPAVESVETAPVEASRLLSNALADEPVTLTSGFESSLSPGAESETATSARVRRPVPASETRDANRGPGSPGSNRPPKFSAPTYAFEMPTRWDGSAMAVPLGVVLARDPHRGPVTYSLTAGDWTRFEVNPSSGAITYVGPGRPGTRQYKLQVTARGRDRLTETATVMVTVASAPAPPDTASTRMTSSAPHTASADTARTYMGVPVLIDVLANDAALSGLRVVAVTPPAHGTTTVTNGMVRYAPAPGHRGTGHVHLHRGGRGRADGAGQRDGDDRRLRADPSRSEVAQAHEAGP